MRSLTIRLLGLVLVAAILGQGCGSRTALRSKAGSLAPHASGTIGSSPSTPATPAAPRPKELRIGLAYGDTLPGLSEADLARTLDDAVALGVGWLRVDLAWDDIQPTSPGLFDWTGFDRVVAAAAARHLQVLPTIAFTPGWARPAGCANDKCAPANPDRFAQFANQAVARYAPLGVHTWEIWNEPNLPDFWLPVPDPAEYVRLVRATAPAMRAADPTVTLISAGLAPAATTRTTRAPVDFLASFCQDGGGRLVDAIGYHPFSYPVPPSYSASWNAWDQITGTDRNVESVLAACGVPTTKLWLTEYGAPTGGPGPAASSSNYQTATSPDHVSEELQATMATQAVQLSQSSPFIAALFWYSYKDLSAYQGSRENFFGLVRADGTPKPAYTAFRNAVAALHSGRATS
jgi:hypothetical protein